jgi:hypothetical protein
MEELIETIKKDFRSYISPNDPKYKRLSKLRGDLFNLSQTKELFDEGNKKNKESKKKIEQLSNEITKLESEIEGIKNNKIYENAFEWRFEFPEVLDGDGGFVGFDVVIGNPPYGAQFNIQEKEYIRTYYKSYQYKFDSYVYFIELGIKLLKPTGFLELITPIVWLNLDNCYPIRSIVIGDNNLKRIYIHGEGVFDEAVINTLSFQLMKAPPTNELIIITNALTFSANKDEWIDSNSLKIEFKISPEKKKVIDKIRIKSEFLSKFGEVIQGITPYDSYQGQAKDIIENRAYHFEYKKDNTCGKWLEGKNLNRYSINWDNKWLSYGGWLAAPRDKRFFEGNRILFREVPGRGKRIQACLVEEEYYYGHSISPFKPYDHHLKDLEYILGIINSKLISWYGNLTLANFGKDIFPKLNPNDIKELPIPSSFDNYEEIIYRVKKIITAKSEDNKSNSISVEKELDQLIYRLYDLTEEEIIMIENNG